MHNIILDRDEIGRLVVVQATASTNLSDPLEGMHSLAREAILFNPPSSAERQLMKACKHLDIHQRRVVAHYIITTRRADYQHKQDYLARRATRLRAQDVIDNENQRQATHLDLLGRQAEKQGALDRQALAQMSPEPDQPVNAPPSAAHRHNVIDDGQEEEDEHDMER